MVDTVQTTQSAGTQHADQYSTTVSVECYEFDRLRRIKWFPDLQQAYIWIEEQRQVRQEEEWFTTMPFAYLCERMNSRWQRGRNGVTVAESDDYLFRAYYEPDVPSGPPGQTNQQDVTLLRVA